MKSLLLLFSSILMISSGYAQRVPSQENQPVLEDKASNIIAARGYSEMNLATFGTFQIVLNIPDMQYAVTEETRIWIEQNRLESEDQTLKIDENISVFIPSKNSISSIDFKPITNVRYTN